MTEQELANKIVAGLLEKDTFSKWLGIEVVEVKPGKAVLRMTVRKDMVNGHGICHGGVTFALADTALAFAANAHGRLATSVECSMAYLAAARRGDVLTAVAEEALLASRIAVYTVSIAKKNNRRVGLFRGVAYRSEREFHHHD